MATEPDRIIANAARTCTSRQLLQNADGEIRQLLPLSVQPRFGFGGRSAYAIEELASIECSGRSTAWLSCF